MTTILDTNPFPAAADIIRQNGWTQGTERDEEGAVCLTGGLRYCDLFGPGEWLIARAVARHRGHGEGWNDASNRTRDEVVGWLDAAAPITDSELGVVFGPQWREVCALVRRASQLTEAESARLDTTWYAARDTTWYAALAAVRHAVRHAVRRHAAQDAAQDAARAAAGAATQALMCRDLIGDTFTQNHYDLLTGPWAQVIGPVHPHDNVG